MHAKIRIFCKLPNFDHSQKMPLWTQNFMENAIKAVQEVKMSMRRAAITFDVTYTTLNNKLTGKNSNFNGAPTALTRTCDSNRFYGRHQLWILNCIF